MTGVTNYDILIYIRRGSDMRTSKNDNNSFAPYKHNQEVEEILSNILNKAEFEKYEKLVDKGLEEKLYETNPTAFREIVKAYTEAKNNLKIS